MWTGVDRFSTASWDALLFPISALATVSHLCPGHTTAWRSWPCHVASRPLVFAGATLHPGSSYKAPSLGHPARGGFPQPQGGSDTSCKHLDVHHVHNILPWQLLHLRVTLPTSCLCLTLVLSLRTVTDSYLSVCASQGGEITRSGLYLKILNIFIIFCYQNLIIIHLKFMRTPSSTVMMISNKLSVC